MSLAKSVKRLQIYVDGRGLAGWTAPREDVRIVLDELAAIRDYYDKLLFLQELLIKVAKNAKH
jgi:hypothetical protein